MGEDPYDASVLGIGEEWDPIKEILFHNTKCVIKTTLQATTAMRANPSEMIAHCGCGGCLYCSNCNSCGSCLRENKSRTKDVKLISGIAENVPWMSHTTPRRSSLPPGLWNRSLRLETIHCRYTLCQNHQRRKEHSRYKGSRSWIGSIRRRLATHILLWVKWPPPNLK